MVETKNTTNVPIATDEKSAVVNAIENETNLYRVGCSRHLRGDITRWVDAHCRTIDDRTVYVHDVMTWMRAKSEE